jgi:D-alanyl-D-alanine carboxypeptidase
MPRRRLLGKARDFSPIPRRAIVLFMRLAVKILAIALCAAIAAASASCAAVRTLSDYREALDAAEVPPAARDRILASIKASQERFSALLDAVLAERAADPMLLKRVDKRSGGDLPEGYAPPDLVALDGAGLAVAREDFSLRRPALDSLRSMDRAARAEGLTLLVSSTFRSYAYQDLVFARNVKELGQAGAERVSARPGRSQHQLGAAVDFGSIDDSFADTKASRWLEANAARFGWSLSYPRGMESVTGYVWESWHYRYVGTEAAAMIEEYFGGLQEYFLAFLDIMMS